MVDVSKFTPIRFSRYVVRASPAERTGRRLAAAARAVKREADAMPLFPQLRRYSTVEERMSQTDARWASLAAQRRDSQASAWRRARAALRALPPLQRAGILRYWRESSVPAEGHYLLDILHGIKVRGEPSGWARLRERRQLRLIGSGKLPRTVLFRRANAALSGGSPSAEAAGYA